MVAPDQARGPAARGAAQGDGCPQGRPQPVGSSYPRVFHPATSFQAREPDGRPTLLRSPAPVAFLDSPGDHYLLGMFDLRQSHLF